MGSIPFSDLSNQELIGVASFLCALLIISLGVNFWSICYIFCELKPKKNKYKKQNKNKSIELTEFQNSNSKLLDKNTKIQNELNNVESKLQTIKELNEGERIHLDLVI